MVECRHKGRCVRCELVEVGCRGFIRHTLNKILINLSLTGNKKRNVICKITGKAETAVKGAVVKKNVYGSKIKNILKWH